MVKSHGHVITAWSRGLYKDTNAAQIRKFKWAGDNQWLQLPVVDVPCDQLCSFVFNGRPNPKSLCGYTPKHRTDLVPIGMTEAAKGIIAQGKATFRPNAQCYHYQIPGLKDML